MAFISIFENILSDIDIVFDGIDYFHNIKTVVFRLAEMAENPVLNLAVLIGDYAYLGAMPVFVVMILTNASVALFLYSMMWEE